MVSTYNLSIHFMALNVIVKKITGIHINFKLSGWYL